MTALSDMKRKFLIQYQDNLLNREFLIDLMTIVGNRPTMFIYEDELPKPNNLSVKISFKDIKAKNAKYVNRFTEEGSTNPNIPNELYLACKQKDIELITEEQNIYDLFLAWRNWNLMTPDKQKLSDEISVKTFNRTNEESFNILYNKAKEPETNKKIKNGDIILVVSIDGKEHNSCVCYIELENDGIVINYLCPTSERIMGETDTFELKKGEIANLSEPSIITTVGRFILNKIILVYSFVNKIPYINKVFETSEFEKKIVKGLLTKTISIEEYKKFIDGLHFIGHFSELCVPTYSEAALVTDPNVAKVRAELLEKYKGRLNDPLVIAEIEDILIKMDKAHLVGDTSLRFYTPLGEKPFNIHRKKMYLIVGGVEAFSKDSSKYDFIENPLSDGWKKSDIPIIANEIRKGSYNRGHETQLGGAQTKYIVRVFQDLKITEDDCHSTKGLIVNFSKTNPSVFLGRYILMGNIWVEITEELIPNIEGKTFVMRSPMYCKTRNGLCYKCSGSKFAALSVKHVTTVAIDISSTFTTMALKLMHGSKLAVFDADDLSKYVI